MSWVKLDDGFHSNPKVRRAGNIGAGVYARALSWCGAYYTDGFISRADAAAIGKTAELRRVTDAELWEEIRPGDTRTVTDRRDSGNRPLPDVTLVFDTYGFFIPDYLRTNQTKDEVEAVRAKKRGAGSKGGQASAQASAVASAEAPAQAERKHYPDPTHKDQKPSIRLVGETRQGILDEFEAKAAKVGLTEKQKARGRMLGPDDLDAVMLQVFSRGDVDNLAAYFVRAIENKHAERRPFRSGTPLEERLAEYVRNEGHEYSNELMAVDLRERGADAGMVDRLTQLAEQLRKNAA